jgi:hypothetical protein
MTSPIRAGEHHGCLDSARDSRCWRIHRQRISGSRPPFKMRMQPNNMFAPSLASDTARAEQGPRRP